MVLIYINFSRKFIPDTLVVAQGSICGMSNISKSKSCLICGNRVILKNDKLASCTKCRMTVKVESCIHDWQLKIKNHELLENLLELSEVQIQYDSITCKLVIIRL